MTPALGERLEPAEIRAALAKRARLPPLETRPVRNAFTVDLEDWAHGLLGGDTPITVRVVANVERMLDLLDRHGIRATFFALGKVCEKHPGLLPRIAAAGHEIASHGYGHGRVCEMTPLQFREDVSRSVEIISQQVGVAPVGFRAPQFSITRDCRWVVRILAELGFQYSSSVFPFAGARYGIADAPRYPFCWRDWPGREVRQQVGHDMLSLIPAPREPEGHDLFEFPLATLECWGRRWPVAGGGYLRLLPVGLLASAIRQANRRRQPAVVYMHPYEMDLAEVRQLRRTGFPFTRRKGFEQSLFRSLIRSRLIDLFKRFEFAPLREILAEYRGF